MIKARLAKSVVFLLTVSGFIISALLVIRYIVHPEITEFSGDLPNSVYFAVEDSTGIHCVYSRELQDALRKPGAHLLISKPECSWTGGHVQKLEIVESSPSHQVIKATSNNTAKITWRYRVVGAEAKLESYRVLFSIGDSLIMGLIFFLAIFVAKPLSNYAVFRIKKK